MPNKFQVGQKVLLKNQRRMNIKGGKRFSPFTVPSISIKVLCSLINKDGAQIKFTESVFLLKPYLDSDETKVSCDEKPPPMMLKELFLQV